MVLFYGTYEHSNLCLRKERDNLDKSKSHGECHRNPAGKPKKCIDITGNAIGDGGASPLADREVVCVRAQPAPVK